MMLKGHQLLLSKFSQQFTNEIESVLQSKMQDIYNMLHVFPMELKAIFKLEH